MSETDHRPRAEFFADEDRRAMRIRIPIHPVFLEKDDKDASTENVTTEENETSFETSLKQADYDKLYIVIQKLMAEKKLQFKR